MPLLSSYPFQNWRESDSSDLPSFVWPFPVDMLGLAFTALFHPDLTFMEIHQKYYGKRDTT